MLIDPVVDLPVLGTNNSTVQENNRVSSSDPELVVPIGELMDLTLEDADGSQSLNLTLSGFPVDAIDLFFNLTLPNVTVTVDEATGTVTLFGEDSREVLEVLDSLTVILPNDGDENFSILIEGTTSDTNGVDSEELPFSLVHEVTVQAVADTPTVEAGSDTKDEVEINSGFVEYGVIVALNDTDGSETFESIVIEVSTPGNGSLPIVEFGNNATGLNVTRDGGLFLRL